MKKKTINTLLILAMAVACAIIMGTVAFANTENEPLCFTAEASGSTVKLVKGAEAPVVSLQYKINDGSWADYTIGNLIALSNVGDKVYFRATSENNVMASDDSLADDSLSTSNHFEMTGKIAASGNVMSLLSLNCTSLESKDYCFANLFCDCVNLTQAPELPATTLAESCYKFMFRGCANLTQAPELPATTLAESCYACMFWGCANLTQAPELSATALAEGCYASMFWGCANLTQAPELPATTLAESCYRTMFRGCANLTQAPELPATTLANSCYSQMFWGCVNLTQAPELPATTLATDCYKYMFVECSSLRIDKESEKSDVKCYCETPMFKITSDSMEQYCEGMLPDNSTPVSGVAYYRVGEHTLTYITKVDDKEIVHYEKCEKCHHEIAQKHIFEPSDAPGKVRCKLCGYVHFHIANKLEGKTPTCMVEGWKDYYECTRCEQYFSDEACAHEIDDIEAWKIGDGKVDKRHKGTRIPQQDATASKDGLKAYWYCRFCDKYYEDDNGSFGTEIGGELALEIWKTVDGKIPKTGTGPIPTPGESTHIHTFSDIWSKSSNYHWHAATCGHNEYTSGFGEHNYNEGTYAKGIKTSICKICGYEKKQKMTLAVPKTTLKVIAGKKYVTAKWTKKSVTGYQLQYGLKSNFKGAKTLTLKSASKVSQKIMKLKSKKKYYVRIRCYTNAYDTTYHSGWVAKKVVIK